MRIIMTYTENILRDIKKEIGDTTWIIYNKKLLDLLNKYIQREHQKNKRDLRVKNFTTNKNR